MPNRIAYLPLNTYPDAVPDPAILAAVGFAASLGCGLHVSTFAVNVPPTVSPIGGFLINVEGMARAAEDRSKAECARLQDLVKAAAGPERGLSTGNHTVVLGAAFDAATTEARTFDLALLPWSAETLSAQDMAQSLVFGAGVPVILVPPSTAAPHHRRPNHPRGHRSHQPMPPPASNRHPTQPPTPPTDPQTGQHLKPRGPGGPARGLVVRHSVGFRRIQT
jgi:hypothetical protein